MLAETYRQSCQSRGLVPREEVPAMEGGSLDLPGNVFERFSNRLTDADVAALIEAAGSSGSSFVEAKLPFNRITSAGGSSIAAALAPSGCLHSLSLLDLSHNELDGCAGVALCQALRDNRMLSELRLAGNPLGADSQSGPLFGQSLADMLSTNRSLCRLDLFGTDLGMKALIPIVSALSDGCALLSLNLGKPLLHSPDDVRYVVHHLSLALLHNRRLQDLELSFFGLRDEDLQQLLQSLCESAVVSLNLRANKLSQDGGAVLARLLERRDDLRYLNVSANRLGDVGAAHLCRSLERQPQLEVLLLQNADIGPAGITCVAEAISKCPSLHTLGLWGNQLQGDGAAHLFAAQERIAQLAHADFGFQVVDGVPAVFKR